MSFPSCRTHDRTHGPWAMCSAMPMYSHGLCVWPKANSAFNPSGVGKWVLALARKAKAGMVHSMSRWTLGVQVKLWDPLKMRAIPERLRCVITTRCYTNARSPLPYFYLSYSNLWPHSPACWWCSKLSSCQVDASISCLQPAVDVLAWTSHPKNRWCDDWSTDQPCRDSSCPV